MTTAKEQLRKIPGLVRAVTAARQARRSASRSLNDARFVADRRRRSAQIVQYLRANSVRKLQLGTGSNPYQGWLNTDVSDYTRTGEVVYLDVRKPFPLPDRSFDLVFSEHMIEHMAYMDGLHCLRECRRVLKPDGRIRVATPSLYRLVQLYEPDVNDVRQRYTRWSIDTFIEEADAYLPGFVLNNFVRAFGHEFVYDEWTLRHALESAGFVGVEEWPVGQSGDPRLAGLERHMRSAPEFNELETMVLEARRP
jgi:predicted SAM-dependent methyltransferase